MFWLGRQLPEVCLFSKSRETTEIDYKNKLTGNPTDTPACSAASQWTSGQLDMRVVVVFLCFNQIYVRKTMMNVPAVCGEMRKKTERERVSEAEFSIKGSQVCGRVGADSDTWARTGRNDFILIQPRAQTQKVTSYLLEKVTAKQPTSFLSNDKLFDKFQTTFLSLRSTETAPAGVTNDLLVTDDSDHSSALLLLHQYCWSQLVVTLSPEPSTVQL